MHVQEKSWILIGVLVTQGHMLPSFHDTLTVCTPSTLVPYPDRPGASSSTPSAPSPAGPHLGGLGGQPARLPHEAFWEACCTWGMLGFPGDPGGWPRGTSGNSDLCLVTPRFPLFAAQPWRQPVPSRVAVTTCSGQVACVTSRPQGSLQREHQALPDLWESKSGAVESKSA